MLPEVVGLTVVMGVATGIVTAAYTFPKIVEALSRVRGRRGRLLTKLKRQPSWPRIAEERPESALL